MAVWRYRALLWVLVALAGLGIVSTLTPLRALPLATSGWLLLGLVVLTAGLVLAWVWPRAVYRHLRYRIDDVGMMVESGVFFRSQAALPRVRIQHADVTQGPLQRRFGVATLKLYTAGSRFTEISLPGLAHEDALRLRDVLLAGIEPDDR
jgi:uncharacterized protein